MEERKGSFCPNSGFCEKYSEFKPLIDAGTISDCPFVAIITKDFEIKGVPFKTGKHACLDSMRLFEPEILQSISPVIKPLVIQQS